MSDTAKRDAVMTEFKRPYFGLPDTYALIDEIVRLRDENAVLTASIERVRALHNTYPDYKARWCRHCKTQEWPCPTLRALEEAP